MVVAASLHQRVLWDVHRYVTAGLDATELLARTVQTLHRAIPFDIYSAATIDPASNLITRAFGGTPAQDYRPLPANVTYFEHFYFQEGLGRTQDLLHRRTWATTLSAHTGHKLDRSLCYRDALKPAGIGDKVHAIFVDGVLWGDVELYRAAGSAAFTADELELLRRVAPMVGAGLKAATLRHRAEVDPADGTEMPGVVVIDHQHRVVSATLAADRLLREIGPVVPDWQATSTLPVALQVVCGALAAALAPAPAEGTPRLPRVQVQGNQGRWLALHATRAEATGLQQPATVVVISPTRAEDLAWLSVVTYGLSPREEDVVKLVVAGLSTRQISDRLFIAEHTVQRHLSNVFEKVGVRSRRALVKELFFDQLIATV